MDGQVWVPFIDLEADLHQQWAFGRQSGADASLVFEYHLGQCLFFCFVVSFGFLGFFPFLILKHLRHLQGEMPFEP